MKKLLVLPAIVIVALAFAACSGTGKFYKMELDTGDIFTGTLLSNLHIETSRGAKIDVPANNIEEIDFGMANSVEVELRDGNEISGRLKNKTLKMKLSATGKVEEIPVHRIERFEKD